MGFIPDDIIETVRLNSDIVEVVSRYVSLRKKGKYFTGSCPFHSDRSPSFTVTPDKQIFHCFGCNAGGDVFKFLMLKENLTFYEAVSMLARRAGIALPAREDPAGPERDRKKALLQRINDLAKDFFYENLRRHEAAAEARRYLAERGLSGEVLDRFQIGFALPGWSALLDFLSRKGCQPHDAAEAGLAVKGDSGRYYDRFRNRIIFPIWDPVGRVVGFGGRVLDGSLPKYLNTPETPFFSKGRILYGLHLARPAIRERDCAVVVEGYMDAVTAHLHGAANTVASLGTALTAEQGRLLINYSRNVVIAYDADAAGVAAAMRGMDLLQELGFQVRVATIPDGKDPDEYIRRQGIQSWEKLIGEAPSLIEYKLQKAMEKGPVRTVTGKLEVMRQVFPNLALKNEVEKEEGLKAIAGALNLTWETVAGEFKRFEANLGKKWANPDNIVKTKHNILSKEEKLDHRGKLEIGLLRLVLEDPSLGTHVVEEMGPEPFRNPQYQKIFELCRNAAGRPVFRPAEIFSSLEDDEKNVLSFLLTQDIPGENLVQIMKNHIDSIRRFERRERREALLKEIAKAEKAGNHSLCNELWREYIILRSIAEAEKNGEQGRAAELMLEYREFVSLKNGKYPREGSDER
ncbi:MAG: DNA primase [Pelotomaculum sp.]|uniref:DNA primase n=1 Tax=Pelotomaculum thermopropionicum (strain DSM 13744 / JCM 10971 / SI) TaxID=370438 RepID=A5D3U5_PELTS|nr:DNA primase [Pelotomaculum sp.]BAF59087.1 DNA primase [Pelotomaculum thermopropionicum SI]